MIKWNIGTLYVITVDGTWSIGEQGNTFLQKKYNVVYHKQKDLNYH